MAKYSAEQFGDLLDRFAAGLPKAIANATVVAGQQLRADIPGRIHRVGGTKDIGGATRRYISKSQVEKRRASGLQTGAVDMTFTGDLQRSYRLVQKQKEVDLIITGQNNVDKARGNEKYWPDKVWEASKKEAQESIEAFRDSLGDYIQQFFD